MDKMGSMLDGKRIAILVYDGFNDIEVGEPLRAMKDNDARVLIVGSNLKRYVGKWGTAHVQADTSADKLSTVDISGIIIPGGKEWCNQAWDLPIVNLVRNMYESERLLAAISSGLGLLDIAGVLHCKCVAAGSLQSRDFVCTDVIPVKAAVVRDGNLITADRPANLPRFTMEIINALAE